MNDLSMFASDLRLANGVERSVRVNYYSKRVLLKNYRDALRGVDKAYLAYKLSNGKASDVNMWLRAFDGCVEDVRLCDKAFVPADLSIIRKDIHVL